jgi:Cdc6-like AAA superfamily ATPase
MSNIKRICVYGGPGSGKSTLSAYVFSQLKSANHNCEQITEYIKFWTYLNKSPKGFDQVYTFAKQLYHVDTVLRGGIDFVITDSPIMLSYYYALKYKHRYANVLRELVNQFEEEYPSFNILLERGNKIYNPVGRYQNENEAKEIDLEIRDMLKDTSFESFQCGDKEKAFECVLSVLK